MARKASNTEDAARAAQRGAGQGVHPVLGIGGGHEERFQAALARGVGSARHCAPGVHGTGETGPVNAGESPERDLPTFPGGPGETQEGAPRVGGRREDRDVAARVSLHDQPRQPPGDEEEDKAPAQDIGAPNQRGQVVDVCGAEARGSDVDGPHDGVVACVPKQGAGRPAHPEAAEKKGGGAGLAGDDPRDPPLGNEVKRGV